MMTRSRFISNSRYAIIFAAILLALGMWSSADTVNAQEPELHLEFREAPSATLDLIRGKITEGSPAHIQITIVNSKLNDVAVTGEVVIKLPNTLLAYSSTDGTTGGSTTTHIDISNPIASGSSEAFDIWVQASPESPGTYTIIAEITLLPTDPDTHVADKTSRVEVTLQDSGSVVSPTKVSCYGKVSIECIPEAIQLDCDELACKPWGWFLIGYAAIASLMISVVTVRSFITRY
jgi:hypothetical protein